MGYVPTVSGRWVWPILVLAFCHLVAIASAQIVNILVDDVRASLSISDVQYSLLQGVAVALFAALVGIPVARLADRRSRRLIIIIGVAGWTIATAACAFAQSFGELFVARACVGIGEVFLFPAASSMIMDLVPRDKLARATALFGCGGPVGAAIALTGGGLILDHKEWFASEQLDMVRGVEPWRLAFMACAALGVIALALLSTVREPARTPDGPLSDNSWEGQNVFAYLAAHRGLYAIVLGGMLALSTAVFATGAWLPTVLIRERGFSATQAGSLIGFAALVFAVFGTWAAGAWADFMNRRGRVSGVLKVAIIMGLLMLGTSALLTLVGGRWPTLIVVCVLFLVQGAPTVLSVTAIQQIAPSHLRAQIVAIYVLLIGITAAIIGPSSVPAMHERVFTSSSGLGLSLGFIDGLASLVAVMLFIAAQPRFAAARRLNEGARQE